MEQNTDTISRESTRQDVTGSSATLPPNPPPAASFLPPRQPQPNSPSSLDPAHHAAPEAPNTLLHALARGQLQIDLLNTADSTLERLNILASLSLQTEQPDRHLLNTEFSELTKTLSSLVTKDFQQHPVFSRLDSVIEVEPPGNKLVLPGVYASSQAIAKLSQHDIKTPQSAAQALRTLDVASKCVQIDQAIAAENILRLSFFDKHLDALKQSLVCS